MPERTAGESIEGEHLVRACDIKHSIRGKRCCLQAKGLYRENPFQLQQRNICGGDLLKGTVAIG